MARAAQNQWFFTAFNRVPMQVETIFGRVNEVVGMLVSELSLSIIAIEKPATDQYLFGALFVAPMNENIAVAERSKRSTAIVLQQG
jgi:hypothetical protein